MSYTIRIHCEKNAKKSRALASPACSIGHVRPTQSPSKRDYRVLASLEEGDNAQREISVSETMIRAGALQQAPKPHVSHAETGVFFIRRVFFTRTGVHFAGKRSCPACRSRRPALRLAHHEIAEHLHA